MIVNIKVSNPRAFRFPSGYSDIEAFIIKPVEVQKHMIGSIESGLIAKISTPILLHGVYGNRFLLLMDERTKVSRVMMGYSVWSDIYLIPQEVSAKNGIIKDTDLHRLGTGMIVMTNKDGELFGDLRLDKRDLMFITNQAQNAFPEECGGLLLGMIIDGDLDVKKVLPLENTRTDSRHNRIEINPTDYIKAERLAMKEGLGVWGFYHSHPNADAIPSNFDREHFPYTNWWYPIISIDETKAVKAIRCWKLEEDREKFTELHIEITDTSSISIFS